MKKLIPIVLLLALPAMAFGGENSSISLLSGGNASLDVALTDLPTTMSLDVVVYFDEDQQTALGGGLYGSSLITVTNRSYALPQSGWAKNDGMGTPALIVGSDLSQSRDWGAQTASNDYINSGTTTFVTLTLDLPTGLDTGSGYPIAYPITIVDSERGPLYYTNVGAEGEGRYFGDNVAGFTLNITPEPATMLLLAGALPFLRRRTA
jgi:hypothetical protein